VGREIPRIRRGGEGKVSTSRGPGLDARPEQTARPTPGPIPRNDPEQKQDGGEATGSGPSMCKFIESLGEGRPRRQGRFTVNGRIRMI